MSYTTFLLKKIYKHKLNAILFVPIMIFIIFVYHSYRTGAYMQMSDPQYSGETMIENLKKDISSFQKRIDDENSTSEYNEAMKNNLQMAKKRLFHYENRLTSYQNEDWQGYYTHDMELQKLALEVTKKDPLQYDEELIKVLELNIAYDQHMIDHQAGYDIAFLGSQGISYMNMVFRYFLSIFLCIIMIYIMPRIFCSAYQGFINTEYLLPLSCIKRQTSYLIAGIITGVLTIALIATLSMLCGTIGNTMGNLHSPILMYSLEGRDCYTSFLTILPQFLVMMLLAILFLVAMMMVISLYFHRVMTCMLIAIIIIMGGLLITPQIVLLNDIMHILPITYVNFYTVLTGEASYQLHNLNVNFTNGVLSLSVSSMILIAWYYFITKHRSKVVIR